MARWVDKMADRQTEHEARTADLDIKFNALVDAQLRNEAATQDMKQALTDLSRTVDRFLRSRSDGGTA
jgi:hypothetical protein